jgi:MEMO1 family protein
VNMKAMRIRPPSVAGYFYPDDPTLLALAVDGMLERHAQEAGLAMPVALIAPHAGYAYSGETAAAAYATLRGWPVRTAVIVSPSHRESFNGVSVYDGDAYRTPLGLLNVDLALRERLLAARGVIRSSALGHRDEHAVEVHLPFLQRLDPHIKILPVVMGEQRAEYCRILGEALATACDADGTVLIASSDLSHFHDDDRARMLDDVARHDIRDFAPMRLLDDVAQHRTEACGAGPVAAVMLAAAQLGATVVHVLDHRTSGDVTGDHARVVGYLSAALLRPSPLTST